MDDSVAKGFFQHQTRLRPRNWSRFSQINREMITPFPHPTATETKQSFSAPNRFHSPNEHRITRNDRNQVFRWKIRRFLVTFVSNEPVEMDTRDNKRQQRQKTTLLLWLIMAKKYFRMKNTNSRDWNDIACYNLICFQDLTLLLGFGIGTARSQSTVW